MGDKLLNTNNFLKNYLKLLLKQKDLKTYNRVKRLYYFFPKMHNVGYDEIKMAMKYPDETYICLSNGDERKVWMDKIYEEKYGHKFEPEFLEERFITLEDFFKHFNL